MAPSKWQQEAWAEYAIATFVIILRVYARIKTVGLKGWAGDDYLVIFVLICFTVDMAILSLMAIYGSNVGITDQIIASLTPEQIDRMSFGSKLGIPGWLAYISVIWGVKGCFLFLYRRVTLGLWQRHLVKVNSVLCGATYIASVLTILLHCHPLHKYWQVKPNPGPACTLHMANFAVTGPANLLTDALILIIPIPLLWRVNLPLRRKVVIGILLCSGVFIMIATTLRMVFSIRDITDVNTSTAWAIRESAVSIVAVNAPCIKPLFSKERWIKSSKHSYSHDLSHSTFHKKASNLSKSISDPKNDSVYIESHALNPISSTWRNAFAHGTKSRVMKDTRPGSEESIIQQPSTSGDSKAASEVEIDTAQVHRHEGYSSPETEPGRETGD
ncbi:hypothetical protein K469DRAFT_597757 [Zopfia rhizophila CBS 207.26]|uniref:Rhodopsin domain-containing protein n=1 Tax=Zopfia rhizophila CBS 207.26 TaxID=1314779 RepID=A0A6A6DKE6_9PEZI|nr:hypothetical protein K469DRAFT_597757 [Zopfia rhizophila CBS 207.26]